ncbi:hypothetical protein ACTJJE_08620 [Mycolicibacterium sp. 22603]|uniref:hypothetical protein n=1 Tax=Mycolicibacterium sp. 22603 TaxID=3453950 RepID=UPI003F878540
MSETVQAPAETPVVTSPVTSAPPTRSKSSTRIYRVAAGVGIAVGAVIIGGAIFLFGLLIGSQSSMGWEDPGYVGSGYEADWDTGMDMGMFGEDDAAFWGEWTGPDDSDAEPSSPTNTQPTPTR